MAFTLTLLVSIPAADFVARWMLGEGRLVDSPAAEGLAGEVTAWNPQPAAES